MSAKGPYARVYQSIVDDPMFERVFHNDHALATWLRMLLLADAMHPVSAPMTSRNPTVRLLIDCGLVIEKPANRYSMRGLSAERERRSHAARIAAGVRWHSDGNAESMPRRDETSKEEQTNGQSPPQSFMRYPTRKSSYERLPGEAVRLVHDGTHRDADKCGVCHPLPTGVGE